jgi:two-component system, LytTR family, response regulator
MTIRTLIVDDEPLARRRILSLLKPDNSFEVLAECADGTDAIRAISEHRPDLVFLDVQMPGTDGFGVLEAVAPLHLPAIIFVTAHDQYAVKAFDAHAVDYLLKPFKRERFLESLDRARNTILAHDKSGDDEKLLSLLRRVSGHRGRLVIRSEGKIVFLRNSEIDWIEAAANYVRIHAGSRIFSVRERITDFEKSLAPDTFVRIHRSIIVNLDAVSEIQSCGGGEYVIVLRSQKELPLGRTYRSSLDNLLTKSARRP